MIIEFKSKAAGAFFMTEPVAKLVFAAIDMELSEKGIFTAEQVPAIRRKLDKAVEQSRQKDHARLAQHDDAVGSGEVISREMPVGLSQRAFPLLDMLKAAEKKGVPIVWGV